METPLLSVRIDTDRSQSVGDLGLLLDGPPRSSNLGSMISRSTPPGWKLVLDLTGSVQPQAITNHCHRANLNIDCQLHQPSRASRIDTTAVGMRCLTLRFLVEPELVSDRIGKGGECPHARPDLLARCEHPAARILDLFQ